MLQCTSKDGKAEDCIKKKKKDVYEDGNAFSFHLLDLKDTHCIVSVAEYKLLFVCEETPQGTFQSLSS